MEPNSLRQLLRRHFNREQLQDLCFDLHIDYEELGPPGSKSTKVRQLIEHCERNGRIPELVAVSRQQRPNVSWPDTSRPLSLSQLLGQKPAPRLPYEPETVPVPAGPFLMGSDDYEPAEAPQHEVVLPSYAMGRYPITNRHYAEFLRQTNHPEPNKLDWFLGQPAAEKLDYPAVGVTWHDAVAYCEWLSRQTEKTYRLPTEAEWEKAARGEDGRLYPWGNEWQDERCNAGGEERTAVTAYDHSPCLSPYGCADMLGNVQEWTLSLWGQDRRQPDHAYPYQAGDGREDPEPDPRRPRLRRIHRGGAFSDDPAQLRCSARHHARPESATHFRGFRVVLER